MKRLILAAVVLFCCATTAAAPQMAAVLETPGDGPVPVISIDVPERVEAGDLLPLEATVPEGATFAWAIIPGEAKLTAVLAVSDDGKVTIHSKTVTVGPEVPVPPPPPPPPPPKPIKNMMVLVVEVRKSRTPEQSRVLLDKTTRQWFDDNGHDLRIVDTVNAPADVAPWIKRAGEALPHVFVLDLDAGGRVAWKGPLPETTLLDLAKKYGAEK